MSKTNVSISFGLVDVAAKADTTAEIIDKQPFIDPHDLALEGVYAPKAATMETDYWKLDGTFKTFPNNPTDVTWGIWSQSMTDAKGTFSAPISLALSFAQMHSSIGLTFEFNPYDNSFCNALNIKWYRNTAMLFNVDFAPDKWRYSCMQKVENYNKIVITFRSMNKPCRYLKVQNIMHGVIKQFEGNEIKNADLLEEVDLSGLTLSINTLDFSLHSNDAAFDIFNPQGIYNLLQKKQQLSVEGTRDSMALNLGTFYLDTMESENSNRIKISAIDGVGIMDGTTFKGGIYSSKNAGELIEEIMTDAGFGYTLDNTLRGKSVAGHIPICTHRAALQSVVFAIGGVVTTAHSGTINIKAIPNLSVAPTIIIGKNRKLNGTKVKLRSLVTGVDLTAHSYTLDQTVSELCKVDLAVGKNEVKLEPSLITSVSLGTIVSEGANYCVINATASGACTITGRRYTDTAKTVSVHMPDLPAGEKENIISVDCKLISSNNAKEIAQQLYNYYQYRIEQELRFAVGNEATGDLVDVETEYGVYHGSIVESLDTNLTGGFITKAVVVGE